MRAELISIGTELPSGITVDTNTAWLARRLAEVGVLAGRHVTVADDRAVIAAELRRAVGSAEVAVVTGGLGPTEDDLTRQALADCLGVPLQTDSVALDQIRAYFRRLGRAWHESNARQAQFPVVYCLPGVPGEMS